MVPLKYLINFLRTLEMPLINSEINLILVHILQIHVISWYKSNSICTNTKLYVSVYLSKNTPVMHLRQLGFTYSVCGPFTKKTKKEYKNSKKQKIHDIFMKTNWIKLVFKMRWLMEILKI